MELHCAEAWERRYELVRSALDCLRMFGIEMQANPTREHVQLEYERIWLNLGERPPQVCDIVWRVFAGESVLPPAVATKLVDSLAQSERELQILKHLCAGKSNKEIAQKLYISESTVKHYAKSVFKKLGAFCRAEAIAVGVKRGLIRIV
jgi:DNA-binding CsgD family transcriptional regulator